MRLLNKVMAAPASETVLDPRGRAWTMAGAGRFAEALAHCPVRYVLDRGATTQCADLFRGTGDLPAPSDRIARFPARRFWLEYLAEEPLPGAAANEECRVGILADLADDARSGVLVLFGEDAEDKGRLLGGTIRFDLDMVQLGGAGHYRMVHRDNEHLAELMECARFVPDLDWQQWATAGGAPLASQLSILAEVCWTAFPMAFCFAALLNSRAAFVSRPTDFTRLNAARTRKGKQALLEHVEISLNLAGPPHDMINTSPTAHFGRSAPRLHFVRGHPVQRAGQVFWRSSHFRGAFGPIPITTARVSGRRAPLALARG